jgi:hypothetical protein
MFDASDYNRHNNPLRPGAKTFDQWLDTEKPVYHGTFRPEFEQAPSAHYGTMGQAVDVLHNAEARIQGGGRRTYYDPSASDDWSDDEDTGPVTHTGRIHARRLTEPKAPGLFTDAEANAAQMGHMLEDGLETYEVPPSIKGSAHELAPWSHDEGPVRWPRTSPSRGGTVNRSRLGARALGEGSPIVYDNVIEGKNSYETPDTPGYRKSIVAPRGSVTSWERDILNDPSQTSIAQDFARRRIRSGQEGSVPFPSPTIPRSDTKQLNFYDTYNPDAREPNAPPFPRDLVPLPQRPDRPMINKVQFQTVD